MLFRSPGMFVLRDLDLYFLTKPATYSLYFDNIQIRLLQEVIMELHRDTLYRRMNRGGRPQTVHKIQAHILSVLRKTTAYKKYQGQTQESVQIAMLENMYRLQSERIPP